MTISSNRPRRQSCLTFGGSQSQWDISINPRRWLAATENGTRLRSRSISSNIHVVNFLQKPQRIEMILILVSIRGGLRVGLFRDFYKNSHVIYVPSWDWDFSVGWEANYGWIGEFAQTAAKRKIGPGLEGLRSVSRKFRFNHSMQGDIWWSSAAGG